MLAEPLVTVGSVGGMMSTVTFALPGDDASCLYTADTHWSWNLSTSSSRSTRAFATRDCDLLVLASDPTHAPLHTPAASTPLAHTGRGT